MNIKKYGLRNKIIMVIVVASLISGFASCNKSTGEVKGSSSVVNQTISNVSEQEDETLETEEKDEKIEGKTEEASATIILEQDKINIDGDGVYNEGNIVTINKPGVYNISGKLSNGQIIVDVDKEKYNGTEDSVELVLNNVEIASENSPIYVTSISDKCIVNLQEGTVNKLTDSAAYVNLDEDAGVIYSKEDLTIKGDGELVVNALCADAIVSKDKLKIKNGLVEIKSVDDGLRAKDKIEIENGQISIESSGDGIKTTNTENGSIIVQDGKININSLKDAIESVGSIDINGGVFEIYTASGVTEVSAESNQRGMMDGNSLSLESSAKAFKAVSSININAGTFTVESTDDCIHAGEDINIKSGTITLSTMDDAIHADGNLVVDGGEVNILNSYEAIEGFNITVNDGNIDLVARDDGFNGSGGTATNNDDDFAGGGGQFESGGQEVVFNGGYVYVDAGGDGLDSNGNMTFNGGFIIVNGPTNDGNGPLDTNGNLVSNGGTVIAVGSAGMAEYPGESSSQNSIIAGVSVSAGDIINIKDSDGNDILNFASNKDMQSMVFSSLSLENGKTYTVTSGGIYNGGSEKDGYYTGGTYEGGTVLQTFTVNSVITKVGEINSRGGMMQPGGDMNKGQRPR